MRKGFSTLLSRQPSMTLLQEDLQSLWKHKDSELKHTHQT